MTLLCPNWAEVFLLARSLYCIEQSQIESSEESVDVFSVRARASFSVRLNGALDIALDSIYSIWLIWFNRLYNRFGALNPNFGLVLTLFLKPNLTSYITGRCYKCPGEKPKLYGYDWHAICNICTVSLTPLQNFHPRFPLRFWYSPLRRAACLGLWSRLSSLSTRARRGCLGRAVLL